MRKVLHIAVVLLIAGICYRVAYADRSGIRVVSVEGKAKIFVLGSTGPVDCAAGEVLKAGTRIKTDKDSVVELAFDEDMTRVVQVKEGADVVILLEDKDKVSLVNGEVVAMVSGLKSSESFRIRTPSATCGARGTTWSVDMINDTTDVTVLEGTVYMRAFKEDGTLSEKEYPVKEGFRRKIKRFRAPGKMRRVEKERLRTMRERGPSRMKMRALRAARSKDTGMKELENIGDRLKWAGLREQQIDKVRAFDDMRGMGLGPAGGIRPSGGGHMPGGVHNIPPAGNIPPPDDNKRR